MTDADAPRPIASDWLSLRRPADEAARQASLPLLTELQAFLAARAVPSNGEVKDADDQTVRIFDLGAGTGANQAWLAPHLDVPQHWTLIDHDPDLLELTMGAPAIDGVIGTEAVVAGIEDLGEILDADPQTSRQRFVTCSALLDLLTPDQLDTLCSALVESQTAALFSLSVTGTMTIDPADPLDDALNNAFNQHQNRGGRAGARGVDLTGQFLARAGFTVTTVDTPWELTGDHSELITRFLNDRADAVLEEEPGLAGDVSQWLERRSEQAADGALQLTIGHRDLLALPPRQ